MAERPQPAAATTTTSSPAPVPPPTGPREVEAPAARVTPERIREGEPIPIEDSLRSWITKTSIILFGLTLLFAFGAVLIGDAAWTRAKEFLQLALPAETALIGAAVGFYFGSRK